MDTLQIKLRIFLSKNYQIIMPPNTIYTSKIIVLIQDKLVLILVLLMFQPLIKKESQVNSNGGGGKIN